ncbi:MAG: hypothetical protein JW732_03245 [Dehalococcoidia bacterium]|nr:hypothetical protein [Dehalococcoidia bacterium]
MFTLLASPVTTNNSEVNIPALTLPTKRYPFSLGTHNFIEPQDRKISSATRMR